LEQVLDPPTVGHLERLGVGADWCCWDVGAGGGSVAQWLSERVGPSGAVLATDIDTRFLDPLTAPNLEVRHHDVVRDPLPDDRFDLIHTRLVLTHLPERDQVLRSLTTALRPGGILFCEEHDWTTFGPTPGLDTEVVTLLTKYKAAEVDSGLAGGFDRFYGQRLYEAMVAAGLVEVTAEGRLQVETGAATDELFRLGVAQRRERILASGHIEAAELDALVSAYGGPGFAHISPTMWSVSGRRPG
jgi:SAM-dependent methyltransferase